MNTTAIISAEIQVSDIPIFEALFKRLKAKKIVVECFFVVCVLCVVGFFV